MSAPTPAAPVTVTEQIAFARHNFDNHQSLLRFTDSKAGALLTIAIFLAGTGITVAKDAVHHISFVGGSRCVLSAIFVLMALGFIMAFSLVTYGVHGVIRTRGARHYGKPRAGADLLWQDHVLAHGSQAEYFSAVRLATPELILRNLTDQVYELASISREKMTAFNSARAALWFAVICWACNIVVSFALLR